jgi:SPP1 gp7 family putative phage head morphogenesis protein
MICPHATADLVKLLGTVEAESVIKMAKKAEKIERKWDKIAEELNEELLYLAVSDIEGDGGRAQMYELILKFLMDHMLDASMQSLGMIEERMPSVPKKSRLAKRAKDLRYWITIWDAWRIKRKPTKAIKKQAESILKEYLSAAKRWYDKASEPIRRGEVPKKSMAKELAKQIRAPLARTKTIVNTETTRYWNEVRRDFYNGEPQVTHYLFMSIRDHRTTKWCRTRHGLVYEKDDPELPPPIHWNCRSEILPLTPFSPNHQKLIQDKSKTRRNNKPEPLPKGWLTGGSR